MPGGDFAQTAIRLAGLTGAALGWQPDDFWATTPAELATILSALSPEHASVDALTLTQLQEQFPDG